MFRGNGHVGLHQLFWNNARETYDIIINLDADIHDIPDEYYITFSEVAEATGDRHYVKLNPQHIVYLFDYYKINKV